MRPFLCMHSKKVVQNWQTPRQNIVVDHPKLVLMRSAVGKTTGPRTI